MKNTLFAIILLSFNLIEINAQSIIVNDPSDLETNFTAEELIENVLINSSLNPVDITLTNLIENPNGAVDLSQRSWGYFKNNDTSFPFEEGVILTSGFAVNAQGPNDQSGTSDGAGDWLGDIDIETILNNQTGTSVTTNNATVFEFSFVAIANEITFEYIFASEEYENDFECFDDFRDGFAFLIRGPGIPDTSGTPFGGVNAATVVGSDDVPVSTLSIHADSFLCGSEEEGVNYFPNLYVSNSAGNNTNEIQYDGRTTILNSSSVTAIPGETYTVKMVISDRGDFGFDSVVFLNVQSLIIDNNNFSVDAGNDLTIANGNAICEGESVTLTANASPPDNVIYDWFFVEVDESLTPIADDMQSIVINDAGTYIVRATFTEENITVEDDIIVEFFSIPLVSSEVSLELCDEDNDGFAIFDLTSLIDTITLGDSLLEVSFFESQADLDAGIPIEDSSPFSNSIPFIQTIIARVTDLTTGCFATVPIILIVSETPVIAGQPIDLELCDIDNDGFESFDLTVNIDIITGGDQSAIVSFHITQVDAESGINSIVNPSVFNSGGQTIFVRVVNPNSGCFTITSFELILLDCTDDTDGDGIIDVDEDLNGNGNLEDDDTDEDGTPNFQDPDDDGDTVLTIDEIAGIGAGFTTPAFIDTDENGVQNYLDNDDDGDLVLTIDEDYNNSGSPLDDDLNTNGIPDFLDSDVALATDDFEANTFAFYPNPSSSFITIESVVIINSLKLYDSQGRLLREISAPLDREITMDIADYPVGIYFIRINNLATQKFVKQ